MEDFNVWEVAQSHKEALAQISDRVELIKKAYQECVAIAEVFDLRVRIDMDLDEQYRQGHNDSGYGQELYWSASAQHC